MGDNQDALGREHARIPKIINFTPKVFSCEYVKGAEGFIHEQHFRLQHKGPGETNPLFHSAGEFLGIGVLKAIKAHDVDGLEGAFAPFGSLYMSGG